LIQGWNVYYLPFLAGLIMLVLPASLAIFAFVFKYRNRRERVGRFLKKIGFSEPIFKFSRHRVNIRFFLGFNVSVALVGLSLLLVPTALELDSDGLLAEQVFAGLFLSLLLALSLFYAFRKGDLSWTSGYHRKEELDEVAEP
jgi:NADH:ubiquinone oxidoreductase subunit 3 (subunit A)